MKYFNYLKNFFFIYIASGIVLGIVVFSLIAIHKHKASLDSDLTLIKSAALNKNMILDEIGKIEAWKKYLFEDMRLNAADIYSEEYFFHALDGIKTNINGAAMTVDKFKDDSGEKALPVSIDVPVGSYRMIIDYIGYLESLKMPGFSISHLSVLKKETGEVLLTIKGDLISPLRKF
ncbi:MAG: hypothetical protein HY756_05375 [Nitrospirae bacterium]|nr:hypothetical protein [Nitrospirota bacterium]